ncbi:hypothetical protein Zmor_004566 [Zophobas morio]|uniref:PDEase domain-containing protein n=1 Tax=Zophobas morio TaxID=2755281 RepID=A0AA38ICJ8_9CUCU|nr:hypothetical protein Zmor_014599 [Zophobas morio]KAJ3660096.1 hypothetical protein Zmor_004566 [Zophobas morio]
MAAVPGLLLIQNEERRQSINVQIIVDAHLEILNMNARYAESVYDSAIWMMSNVNRHLRNKYLNENIDYHLIGDEGYPLSPWLMGGYNKNNPEHRYVFVGLLVTCADLSDHTKDWSVVKNVALDLYEELLAEQNITQDISAKEMESFPLPDFQIEFLKQVCLPVFKLLGAMFVPLKELTYKLKKHILYWECSKHIFQKAIIEGIPCVEMLQSEQFDATIEATVKLLQKK